MSGDITILRTPHTGERPYFSMARCSAQDDALSFEALGLLTYLLSKPDDWKLMVADLKRRGWGRDKVKRILKELETAGYLTVERGAHDPHTKQFAPNTHIIHEVPVKKPFTEKPSTGEPSTANPPHTYNREEQSTEDNDKDEERFVVFSVYEQNIGLLTPLVGDALKDLSRDYTDTWVCDAIKAAVLAEKRSLAYITGVLKNWKREGRDAPKSAASERRDPYRKLRDGEKSDAPSLAGLVILE